MTDTMVYNILKNALTPEEREEARKMWEEKRKVYVSLPFTGLNLLQCVDLLNEINEWGDKEGFIAFSPVAILFTLTYLPLEVRFEVAKKLSLQLIPSCEETWFFGNTITNLMAAEIRYAGENGKPTSYLQRCKDGFFLVKGEW